MHWSCRTRKEGRRGGETGHSRNLWTKGLCFSPTPGMTEACDTWEQVVPTKLDKAKMSTKTQVTFFWVPTLKALCVGQRWTPLSSSKF